MIWAYYRVSTDKQDYHSQKVGVDDYCKRCGYKIDKEVIDEGVSGTVKAKDRNLRKILKQAVKDDIVITSELSRFGRSTIDVLDTCNTLSNRGVKVIFVKQSLQLDDSAIGKLLTSIFATFAEFERDLLVARTKEGLERAKRQGKKLGRPIGSTYRKLDWQREVVIEAYKKCPNITRLAKKFQVNKTTMSRYLRERGLR